MASLDTQKNALIEFYRLAHGSEWLCSDNWISEEPISSWFGITVDSCGNIVGLNLPRNHLIALPGLCAVISNLLHLEELNLGNTYADAIGWSTLEKDASKLNNLGDKFTMEDLSILVHLRVIDLSGLDTSITDIPEQFENLASLEYLNLAHTKLCEIPTCVGNLLKLQTLNVSHTEISRIPSCLGNLKELTTLNTGFTNLSKIPKCVGELLKLQTLDVSHTKISRIPSCLGNLVKLKTLRVCDTNISEELPECVGDLLNLQILDFSYTEISEIPECLGNLVKLKTLDASHTHISELPECVGDLLNLQILDFSYTEISEIPECLGNLVKLKTLDASHTHISEIPECVEAMFQLETLLLNDTSIEELPDCLRSLKRLQTLNVSNCNISEFPDCVEYFTMLRNLDVSSNAAIDDFPYYISELTQLEILVANCTNITEIPACIGKLSQLRVLDVSHTKISDIPNSLGKLTMLQKLDVGATRITVLPDCIGHLLNLKTLDVRNTHFSEIPSWIGNLVELKKFIVLGVEITGGWSNLIPLVNLTSLGRTFKLMKVLPLPSDLHDSKLQEQLEYLRMQRTNCLVTSKRCKIVLVGAGNAGKTTLSHRLRRDEFLTGPGATMTDGIEMEKMMLSGDIACLLLDLAGQDVYKHTHSMFFNNQAIYVVVHMPRSGGESELDRSFQLIEDNAPAAPIVVVTTKAKECVLDNLQIQELKSRHPRIVAVCAVDSYTGQGIAELQEQLARVAMCGEEQEVLQTVRPVPEYLTLLELRLKSFAEREPTIFAISHAEFSKMAVEQCRIAESFVSSAVKLFCTWGIVYKLSNDDLVLRPKQLADVMACVFTGVRNKISSMGQCTHGLLCHSDEALQSVWGAYDAKLWKVGLIGNGAKTYSPFLDLLHDSGLAYPLFDSHGISAQASLVPALLPTLPVGITSLADAKISDNLATTFFPQSMSKQGSLELTYDNIAPAFFGQLQVKLRCLAMLNGSWRHGCALRLQDDSLASANNVSYAIVHEHDSVLEITWAGASVAARSVVLNAVMALQQAKYPSMILKIVKLKLTGHRTLTGKELEDLLQSPGYIETTSGLRLSLQSLLPIFPRLVVQISSHSISSSSSTQFPPEIEYLRQVLATCDDRVSVFNKMIREKDGVIVEAMKLCGLPMSLKTMWVVLYDNERDCLLTIPVSPGVNETSDWVLVEKAAVPSSSRLHNQHENTQDALMLGDLSALIQEVLVKILGLKIPSKFEWRPLRITQASTDLLCQQDRHFTSVQGSTCSFMNLNIHVVVCNSMLSVHDMKLLSAQVDAVQRTVSNIEGKVDKIFDKLSEAVSDIRSEVSGLTSASNQLYTLWGQKFSNLEEKIANGELDTEKKVKRVLQTFANDFTDKLDEFKVPSSCMDEQFALISKQLQEVARRQACNNDNCQAIMTELKNVQCQLVQVLQMSEEHKQDFAAGISMLRSAVLDVNQRTFPTTFVILAAPREVPPDPPTISTTALKGFMGRNLSKVCATMTRGLDKASMIITALSDPTTALIDALHDKRYLSLICEKCRAPSGEPYEITSPKETVAKILPLARVSLKFVCVVNTVSSFGRLFGLATPVIDPDTLQSMSNVLGQLQSDTLDDFQAVQQAVQGIENVDQEPGSLKMSLGSCARSFEQFLLSVDPKHEWGGLCAQLTEQGEVVFVCGDCATSGPGVTSSSSECAASPTDSTPK